ncbi:MAG: M23 family metallopeptidase [Fibrobacteres bacterium]|nr:M23 family metallopeptidase [Fibrobacterota bacterium]
MKYVIFTLVLVSMGFAFNFPDTALDPATNRGPDILYPDSAKDRLYLLPFDSGKSYTVTNGVWNRPTSGHKGYAVDWNMPTGSRVIAARAGNINYIAPWDPGNTGCMVTRVEKDSTGKVVGITSDLYIHIVLDTSIKMGRRIERGQIIGRVGTDNHLHLEIQVTGHTGIAKDGRTTADVPYPIFEVRTRKDGIPWMGDVCKSVNPFRPASSGTEIVTIMSPEISLIATPNPFTNTAAVTLSLPEGHKGTLNLYDIQGRFIQCVQSGYFPPGQNRHFLNAFTDKQQVGAGRYFLRFKSETKENHLLIMRR